MQLEKLEMRTYKVYTETEKELLQQPHRMAVGKIPIHQQRQWVLHSRMSGWQRWTPETHSMKSFAYWQKKWGFIMGKLNRDHPDCAEYLAKGQAIADEWWENRPKEYVYSGGRDGGVPDPAYELFLKKLKKLKQEYAYLFTVTEE